MSKLVDLLPELRGRAAGKRGMAPTDWLFSFARSDHAVAYAAFFWPDFTIIDDHVLREPVTSRSFRQWRKQSTDITERHQREALFNTLYIDDILFQHEEMNALVEERCRYVGRILTDIHELKLARDFPDRRFVVELWDGTQPEHGGEVSLSFWQQT